MSVPGALPARGLRILAPGALTLVEDLGRPGWFSSGVGVSGAVDRASLVAANRLVGNDDGAPCLETLLGGLQVEAIGRSIVAVTGAPTPLTLDGSPWPHHVPLVLTDGARLELGSPAWGLRSYLAVRGGFDVDDVLGSASRDTLAGLGPEPVAERDVLAAAAPHGPWPSVPRVPVSAPRPPDPDDPSVPVPVRVRLGPREDWFTDAVALLDGTWIVSSQTDRVGARLERPRPSPGSADPAIERRITRELPTEGMPLGAIQVPPSGQPVVFLADHPITGGYPVIATVLGADLARVAQARPGQALAFHARPGVASPAGGV